MGCCASQPEDPAMVRVRTARDCGTKAMILLQIGSRYEKSRRYVSATKTYAYYIQCMAVHCFKEVDRKKIESRDNLINLAQKCRNIYMHRVSLRNAACKEANSGCCNETFVMTDPPTPQQLAPWEWQEWIKMCCTSESIEACLKRMGLIKQESKQTQALRLAEASRATSNVNVSLNNDIRNNNTVSPNISVAGPTTTVSPNMSNAQTGEGNVQPVTAGTAGAVPMQMAPGMMQPMMMMPQGSGNFMMVPAGSGGLSLASSAPGALAMSGSLGSGEYAAMMAAQQQQMAAMMQQQQQMLAVQQQQLMAAQQQMGAGGSGMVGGVSHYPMPGMMPQAYMPAGTLPMSPMHSGISAPLNLPTGKPVAGAVPAMMPTGVPVGSASAVPTGVPVPATPPLPEGYPAPTKAVV